MHRFLSNLILGGCLALAPASARAEEGAAAPAGPQPIAIADLNRTNPVDFESDVLPFLRRNCLACHGLKKPKGGFVLETPQSIAKGGDSGPAVVPGKPMESLLLKVAAHLEADTVMPPKDNKANARDLSPEELGLLKLWIEQGAKGEMHAAKNIDWIPMPSALNVIHAVALSQDGQFAACGRANHIDLYHLPTRRHVGRLSDPSLVKSGLYQGPGAAHRDLVNALAFNPAGDLLASGSFREIKLWRRVFQPAPVALASSDPSALSEIQCVAASADGQWLATAGSGPAITLWKVADGTLDRVLTNDAASITCLSFSPDNTRLAVGTKSKSLRWFDLKEPAQVHATQTPAEVNALAWGLEGRTLLTGESDNVIRIWQVTDTPEGAPVKAKELTGHTGPVNALASIGDKRNQLLSGSEDGTVRLWNLEDGSQVREMKHGGPVADVAVRPDGKRFASAGKDSIAKLWQAEDGKALAELKGDRYASEAVAKMERSKSVASGELAYRKSDLQEAEKEHSSQTERVKKATDAFGPAEKAFAEKKKSSEEATQAKADKEKQLADLHQDIKRVTETFETAEKASKEAEAEAKNWAEQTAVARADEERSLQGKAESETFFADAQKLADRSRAAASMSGLTGEEKTANERRAADAETVLAKAKTLAESARTESEAKGKTSVHAKEQAGKAIERVASKAFAAGQARVDFDRVTKGVDERLKQATNAIADATKKIESADKELKKAELEKTKATTELELGKKAVEGAAQRVEVSKKTLATAEESEKKSVAALDQAKKSAVELEKPWRSVAFSADGQTLATGGEDGAIHTWSAENGAPIERVSIGSKPVLDLAFAGPATVATAAAGQKTVIHSLAQEWKLERILGSGDADSPLTDRVNALAFSPDGARLAAGGGEPSRSGQIVLWNVADGALIKDLSQVHSDTVLGLSFSPDGNQLASGASDKFARITDVNSGEVIKSFEGHTHHVMGVAWKADGRTLVTAGADRVIKVWDILKGERKKNIEGFDKEITSVQFVGVSDEAVVSSGDHRVRLIKEDGKTVRDYDGADDFQHAVAVTPDGAVVVAGGEAGLLKIWDGKESKPKGTFEAPSGK